MVDTLPRVKIGGITTIRATRAELADQMVSDIDYAKAGKLALPRVVVASNGSVIARYHNDSSFQSLLDAADMVDADGMPLVLFTRFLWKTPLPERIATTDFIHDACKVAQSKGFRFYFLGANPGIAEQAAKNLKQMYGNLQIVGTRDGYFKREEEADICAEIREKKTDVLWVGLGSPYQEQFAMRNRAALAGVGWIRTCGGLFDHCGGNVRRAPMWMQNAGLEWLHRASLEPRRLGARYLTTNPAAMWHLFTKSAERLSVQP